MITARQIMSTSYNSLLPSTKISEAVKLFKDTLKKEERRIFGMMVIDENDHLAGILSMYDILLFMQPKHVHIWGEMSDIDVSGLINNISSKCKNILVGDIMSPEVITVNADTHLFSVLEIMNRKHIRRIPVIEDNHVIGIVYISDLFFHLLDTIDLNKEEEYLNENPPAKTTK